MPAGEVTLNGEEARKFATYRYLTSDFGHAKRQQQLIWAIRNQAKAWTSYPRPSALERAFRDVQDGPRRAGRAATGALRPRAGLDEGHRCVDARRSPAVPDAGGHVGSDHQGQGELERKLGEMFTSRPLAELGKTNGKCPPPPPGFTVPAARPTARPTETLKPSTDFAKRGGLP